MKTYISAGIGDMVCIDSILSSEQRHSITEIFWACRFGKELIPLFENNTHYPNIRNHHVIADTAGIEAMKHIDQSACSFWHFRPDIRNNFRQGCELFSNTSFDFIIDAATMFSSSDSIYHGSSFIDCAVEQDVCWNIYDIHPKEYMIVHYPTSTRPRSDIASISSSEWDNIKSIARDRRLKIVVITDSPEVPLSNEYKILFKPPIRTLVALVKYASFYIGCDSFCSILAVKALEKDSILIKSHKSNIQQDILSNTWQQKYFLPLTPQETSQIYKNYI